MSIIDKFPVRESTLSGDHTTKLGSPDERSQIGVLLSRSDTKIDWLSVTYGTARVEVGLNVNTNGKSTITEKRNIPFGESYVFGRAGYPWVHEFVSREHVEITPVKRVLGKQAIGFGVMITDLDSTNGTSIWTPDSDEEKGGRRGSSSSHQGDEKFDAAVDLEMIEVENLEEKYGTEFSELEQIDYGILSTMIKSHPEALSSRKEKLKIVALIHPDRNITGDPKRSHQLYILALRILSIEL